MLDSGAVIALSHNDQPARAALAAAWEAGAEVSIPAVVVAETGRGFAKDATVNRVINAVGDVTVLREQTARLAGALLGATRSSSTVDALVVASAVELGGGIVLTGDSGDLGPLAAEYPEVVIRQI